MGGSEPTPYAGQLRCILQPHAVTTTLKFVACGLLVGRDAISQRTAQSVRSHRTGDRLRDKLDAGPTEMPQIEGAVVLR